jgi:hypothetical protein
MRDQWHSFWVFTRFRIRPFYAVKTLKAPLGGGVVWIRYKQIELAVDLLGGGGSPSHSESSSNTNGRRRSVDNDRGGGSAGAGDGGGGSWRCCRSALNVLLPNDLHSLNKRACWLGFAACGGLLYSVRSSVALAAVPLARQKTPPVGMPVMAPHGRQVALHSNILTLLPPPLPLPSIFLF